MTLRNIYKIFLSLLILAVLFPTISFAQGVDPNFNPGKLIDDKIFADIETFGGAEGVQKFLESRGSVLANTATDFLVMLKEPTVTLLKQGLDDPRPSLGRLRTAAELIWDASRQSGLNPQVILVKLQKEQSLITGHKDDTRDKLQKVLDKAMGFDCPDSGGCGNLFPGFYYQLFGNFDSAGNRYLGAAKSLMKSFNAPEGRGPLIDASGMVNGGGGETRTAKVGDTIIVPNTQGGFDGVPATTQVTLLNRATAALYRYTPHVFNGNYNFWRFFNEWFRYPNGTLIVLANDIRTYIVQNGTKQLVPDFVAKNRGLVLGSKVVVSPTEFESYPTDEVYGPKDDTIVKVEGDSKLYVFVSSVKHPASEFVIKQRGLDPTQTLTVSTQEASLFNEGSVLTPKNGTVLRGVKEPAVYLVDNGTLKLFSAYTFKQRKITAKEVELIPDEEIATYPKQGFVAPLDGTLITHPQTQTVYLVENGLKHPFTYELFKNRGLSFKNVVELTREEVTAIPIGAFATPKEITWLANAQTKELYLFKEGSLHKISSFVAKQRGITPDYFFSAGEIIEWQEGIPYPPSNGTLVKGDKNGTVYLVSNGQLRGLTGTAFKNRRYSFKNVKVLPQAEVDAYAKGEVISK